jgi:hypothetical protein
VADLTGFEPATSALTGRRALRAAPQVRGNRTLLGPVESAAEQPFTVAGPRFGPTPGKCLSADLRDSRAKGGDTGFEVRVPRFVQCIGECCCTEPIGDPFGLGVALLYGCGLRKRPRPP